MKTKTSYSLTPEAQKLLKALADKYGISKSAMLEIMIREKAKADDVIADRATETK